MGRKLAEDIAAMHARRGVSFIHGEGEGGSL